MKTQIHKKDQYCAGPQCDCGYNTKTQHTPGPWITYGWKNSKTFGIQPEKSDGVTGPIINDTVFRLDNPMDVANARLIAAAPELLELAKYVLKFLTADVSNQENQKCLNMIAQKAIAKAEGRE